ncbi:MAG: acyl-CoA dehydrogenase [Bdellovibrionaceae bacterium]|nr:acyl-CoA dehydrogenase [Pseudobdellovibrionaceae bacterium]
MGALMQYHGYLLNFTDLACIISFILIIAMGYFAVPILVWGIVITALLFLFQAPMALVIAVAVISLIFIVKPIRKVLVSKILMKLMAPMMPKISDTEKTALKAGTVWVEAELFSGKPNFKKIMKEPKAVLTQEEKDFIDGPLEELCELIDDWETWKTRKLSDKVFTYIKEKKFLGMIIPKEYGGLGFSASAHGEVISKISSRSLTAGITVMVPNSLGPAELLNHYGTQEQKDKYLNRLATGQEIPCFGLTEPTAGSDAGSIISSGVLFKGDDGKIKIKLNWNKRWITLAAISSIIGLAFKLRDPENLLGNGEDLGITVALVPANTPGVVIGRRHDPLGVPFYNCPTQGHDVIVDAEESIVGGVKNAGNGWTMLMESLGAGRGISLPSQSVGGLKTLFRAVTGHATLRKQFGVAIGKFEGVEEPISRILGATYYTEAMRQFTFSALNQGKAPAVVTAIAKLNATEFYRSAVNDAMDVLGGSGISMGPRNVVAQGYIAAPIAVTVEGANILTRTLIIFGQGALRAHPFAFKEVDAVENNDVGGFDYAFWGHMGHVVRNSCRSFVLSVTRGHFSSRGLGGPVGRYYQKLNWASASFAIMSDIAMGLLGGKLKFMEKMTGRFADILSWLYIATSVLKRYEEEGRKKEDLPFVDYSMLVAFQNIQRAFDEIFANFNVPLIGLFFKGPIKMWSRLNRIDGDIKDSLTHKLCVLGMTNMDLRNRYTDLIFVPKSKEDGLGRMEHAYKMVMEAEAITKKIRKAVRAKTLPRKKIHMLIDLALEKGVITAAEQAQLKESEDLRSDYIQVDDFSEEEFVSTT